MLIEVLGFAIWLYLLLLIARMVIGLVVAFARDFQPRGLVLVAFESVFSVTDPPLKALRRVIPPLRLGQISLDLAFLVLFILLQVLLRVIQTL
ncbi:MAG: YggT family protein [Candidatus Nanopelagicales bacterium]